MSQDPATLLLVSRDEATVGLFRATLELERQAKLLVAVNPQDALRMAHDLAPHLVVVSGDMPGLNVFAFCQQLRQDPVLEAAMVVLIIEPGANDMRYAGLTFGVDEYLTRPLEPAEILTKIHTMLRLKKAAEQLRADQLELQGLHEHLRASFDQMLQLMANMLDIRIPGAAARGRHIADLALKVAARFGIPRPHLRDLEIAARLHELGRMLSIEDSCAVPLPSREAVDRWHYVLATRAIFSKVEGLQAAAELVSTMYENWDGTGHPDHFQRGQIPLRARILRVLVDLFTELESPDKPDMDTVLEDLHNHAGTRYDPMVLVHLRTVLRGVDDDSVQGKRALVPIPELRVGMVLADDLFTDSGLKLLARETRITQSTLELILRRHQTEPIVSGATVLRASMSR